MWRNHTECTTQRGKVEKLWDMETEIRVWIKHLLWIAEKENRKRRGSNIWRDNCWKISRIEERPESTGRNCRNALNTINKSKSKSRHGVVE